jgi:L-threonylcarbamoyladenylate synthase
MSTAHEHKRLSGREGYLRAVEVLRAGGVVALPTDTVYGLCAVAADTAAVERVYEVKARDPAQPMPIFVASFEQAALIGEVNRAAETLAAAFWPGALTIVMHRQAAYESRALAGCDTAGVRAPADPALREMAAELGPLTATSANIAGREECHTAEEVYAQLGDAIDLIIDAPIRATGVPSTIVDCTEEARVRVARDGAISRSAIAEAVAGIATVV